MATTWMKPLHTNKGKSAAQTIKEQTDYADNPDKTRDGELVTGYECAARTVDLEFLMTKNDYHRRTGREQGANNIIAYHIRQAFKPGEITPEDANRIGYDLAMRFTKGKHAQSSQRISTRITFIITRFSIRRPLTQNENSLIFGVRVKRCAD